MKDWLLKREKPLTSMKDWTVQQREARLQRTSTNQCQRLATESAEQRGTRLQQLSINQRQRLAAETVEQREDRRQRASERTTCASR